MQTLQNGARVPTNSDPYKLTEDLAAMGDTLNVIIPSPTKEFRDALEDKFPGMTVSRLDLPDAPLQTFDGTSWSPDDVPWTNLQMAQAFDPVTTEGWSGLKYAVKNGWVIINGAVKRATAWPTGITCAVLPASIRPAVRIQGTNSGYVGPEGNVSLAAGSVAVSISLTYPLF